MNKHLFNIPTLNICISKKKFLSWNLVILVVLFCWDGLFNIHRSWQAFTFLSLLLFLMSSRYLSHKLNILSREQLKLLRFARYSLIVCGTYYIYLFIFLVSEGNVGINSFAVVAAAIMPYAYPPIFVIIFMAFYTANIYNKLEVRVIRVLAIYLTVSLLTHLGMGFSISQSRNAFWGCITIILMCYNLRVVLIYNNVNIIKRCLYVALSALLFSFPFFASLRGASGIALISLIIMCVSALKEKSRKILLIMFIIPLIVYVLVSGHFYSSFEERDIHGYSNPLQVLYQGYSLRDPNAIGRMQWWKEAFNIFMKDPIVGTGFNYSFSNIGPTISSRSLHNYYISMLVDGGIILIIPCIGMVIYGFCIGFRKFNKGDISKGIYIAWGLIVTLTYLTNCYGHASYSAGLLALIQGYSLCRMTDN